MYKIYKGFFCIILVSLNKAVLSKASLSRKTKEKPTGYGPRYCSITSKTEDVEGSPQEASSGRSMYYNGPAHQRTIPVSFGSPIVYTPTPRAVHKVSFPGAVYRNKTQFHGNTYCNRYSKCSAIFQHIRPRN
jgi:hypothetical protein